MAKANPKSTMKRRTKFNPVMKPAEQQRAEMREIGDDIGRMASEVKLAAFAATGMAEDLNGDGEGHGLANWLHAISDRLSDVGGRLSPIDIEATKRALDQHPR
jgi:hypothetical protein